MRPFTQLNSHPLLPTQLTPTPLVLKGQGQDQGRLSGLGLLKIRKELKVGLGLVG